MLLSTGRKYGLSNQELGSTWSCHFLTRSSEPHLHSFSCAQHSESKFLLEAVFGAGLGGRGGFKLRDQHHRAIKVNENNI